MDISEEDELLMMLEVGSDDSDPNPHKRFFKRRSVLGTLFKNFRKSQSSKLAWNRHRFQFMSAIRDFQKSTKGRRFQRQLHRFQLTHLSQGTKEPVFAREDAEWMKEFSKFLSQRLLGYLSLEEQFATEYIIELLV